MRKPVLAILFSAISLASLAATSATAMPIAAPVAPTTSAEQIRWICNVWGRCWWQPDYYRRYGYYGYRYGDDDGPYGYGYRHGYGYYGPHWGGYGWRRGWDDDDEQ